MIELNKKTQQDFLNREWVQKLLDAGVDMSDAKYYIVTKHTSILIRDGKKPKTFKADFIITKEHYNKCSDAMRSLVYENVMPTYTTSDLLYKLNSLVSTVIDGETLLGSLCFEKRFSLYNFFYSVETADIIEGVMGDRIHFFSSACKHPIESLAQLLNMCMRKGLGCVKDINDK